VRSARSKFPCLAIIEFKAEADEEARESALSQANARERRRFEKFGKAVSVVVPTANSFESLTNDQGIKQILPDRKIYASAKPTPGKPSSAAQVIPAGIRHVGALPGTSSLTGSGIGIAIVDTGIDLKNADLHVASTCFSAFTDCQDRDGHGTHVAGIAAALDNTIDVVGVAPGATVYAVKVLDDRGNGSDSTLLAGLEWIANNAGTLTPPIRVVNMSLGRAGKLEDNSLLRNAIRNLKETLSISVVVAAGNDAKVEVTDMVPAGYPEVLAVASSTALDGSDKCSSLGTNVKADTASYFTTDGAFNASTKIGITISAPGEDSEDLPRSCILSSVGILSLRIGGGTTRMSGTSMAAPHVTGAIALILQQGGNIAPENVRQLLRGSASKTATAPYDAPLSNYTFDGEYEGVLSVCQAIGTKCPL